jgi:hypothetical protein
MEEKMNEGEKGKKRVIDKEQDREKYEMQGAQGGEF